MAKIALASSEGPWKYNPFHTNILDLLPSIFYYSSHLLALHLHTRHRKWKNLLAEIKSSERVVILACFHDMVQNISLSDSGGMQDAIHKQGRKKGQKQHSEKIPITAIAS
jgi:hypothetical protein